MKFKNNQIYGVTDGGDNHPWLDINVSRGSEGEPLPVEKNDDIGGIRFNIYTGTYDSSTGTTYKPTAAIKIITAENADPTSKLVASDLGIYVGNNQWRYKYNFSGTGTFSAPHIQLSSYSTLEAVAETIKQPTPGMLVYVKSESKFFGYVDKTNAGTPGWIQLNM